MADEDVRIPVEGAAFGYHIRECDVVNLCWRRSDEREIKYSDGHDARPCSTVGAWVVWNLSGVHSIYLVFVISRLYFFRSGMGLLSCTWA